MRIVLALVVLSAMTAGVQAQPADSEAVQAGQNLSNARMPGAEFVDRDLSDTVWHKADLRGARFTQCDLKRADFSEAYLNGAIFQLCDLTDAKLDAAVLPGAYFDACEMSGATFSGAFIGGMALVDVAIAPTGATHLPAVRAALQLHGDELPSPALLAATSGDAFAFSYQGSNPDAWPGSPMTFNPILLALDTLGHDASLRTNMSGAGAATKELTSVLRRGLVALVPMKLAGGGGLTGNAVEDAIWCAIHQVSNEDTGYEAVRVHTPFGPMDMPMEDVVRRWRGPWTTLVPAGDGQYSATYAMVTVGARKETLSPLDVDVEILRNASAILNEPRSYAEAYGGFAAYEALMADLKRPAEDVSAAILWSGKPRQQLIASRILAAAYLREAAPNMPDAARTSVERAAALYDQVVTVLRDEWPLPEAKAFEGENAVAAVGDAAARRPHAIAALEEALSRERRAIALMEQAVADAVRAQ